MFVYKLRNCSTIFILLLIYLQFHLERKSTLIYSAWITCYLIFLSFSVNCIFSHVFHWFSIWNKHSLSSSRGMWRSRSKKSQRIELQWDEKRMRWVSASSLSFLYIFNWLLHWHPVSSAWVTPFSTQLLHSVIQQSQPCSSNRSNSSYCSIFFRHFSFFFAMSARTQTETTNYRTHAFSPSHCWFMWSHLSFFDTKIILRPINMYSGLYENVTIKN